MYPTVLAPRCPEKGEAPGSCTARETSAKAAPNVKGQCAGCSGPSSTALSSLALSFPFFSQRNNKYPPFLNRVPSTVRISRSPCILLKSPSLPSSPLDSSPYSSQLPPGSIPAVRYVSALWDGARPSSLSSWPGTTPGSAQQRFEGPQSRWDSRASALRLYQRSSAASPLSIGGLCACRGSWRIHCCSRNPLWWGLGAGEQASLWALSSSQPCGTCSCHGAFLAQRFSCLP